MPVGDDKICVLMMIWSHHFTFCKILIELISLFIFQYSVWVEVPRSHPQRVQDLMNWLVRNVCFLANHTCLGACQNHGKRLIWISTMPWQSADFKHLIEVCKVIWQPPFAIGNLRSYFARGPVEAVRQVCYEEIINATNGLRLMEKKWKFRASDGM